MYDDWEEFRAEVHDWMTHRERSVFYKWLSKIEGFKETIGYSISISNNEVTVYTTRPGVLIGRGGATVDELKKLMSEEFGGEWKVKFIEIQGGFISV